METIYKNCIEKNILPYNKQDLMEMTRTNESTLKKLQEEKNKDPENENYIMSIDKKIAEYYAQIVDLKNCDPCMKALMKNDSSLSLQVDIYLCKIRLALILKNKKMLEENILAANDVCHRGCDWDRRNKFKTYDALFKMMRIKFSEAALLFCESLPSFDSEEVISYNDTVIYLIFTGLLSFDRVKLKAAILECSDVLEAKQDIAMELAISLYECQYDIYLRKLHNFIMLIEEDPFIGRFANYFCKEMKLRAYKQLLESYQCLSLQCMADTFKISEVYLEKDLSNYIVEKRIDCSIDKMSGVITMREPILSNLANVVERGNMLIRTIKKNIK